MIGHIAARELRSLFLSPLAWSILAVVLFILAFLFLSQLDLYMSYQAQLAMMESAPGVTESVVAPLFSSATIILLLVVPLITMRLISEERRNRTLPLLFSAPISMTEIVLGKYLGILGFLGIMLGLIVLMPLSLLLAGRLDFGLLLSGLLGLTLMLAAFAAAGLFMSTLTNHPTVAAVASFGLLLLLWVIDWASGLGGEGSSAVFGYLSLQKHYQALLSGLFDSSDVVYYLLFITTFLVLSIRRLDADRLQH
ncbi:MAG TPA: ABC transporter permease subunit [Gammaproteobacteria bacterium]